METCEARRGTGFHELVLRHTTFEPRYFYLHGSCCRKDISDPTRNRRLNTKQSHRAGNSKCASDLNRIAPGRVDFGVGTGFTARRTMGLKAIPLRVMKRYIERVQELLRGNLIEWDFESENRKISFLNLNTVL